MMRKAILTFAALAAALVLRATGLDSVLASVERNNLGLQALRKGNEAAMIEVRGGNAPGDPSVEYSPFFRSGAGGVASSELVVSQGFDFPTLYAARRKSARLRQAALDRQYEVELDRAASLALITESDVMEKSIPSPPFSNFIATPPEAIALFTDSEFPYSAPSLS